MHWTKSLMHLINGRHVCYVRLDLLLPSGYWTRHYKEKYRWHEAKHYQFVINFLRVTAIPHINYFFHVNVQFLLTCNLLSFQLDFHIRKIKQTEVCFMLSNISNAGICFGCSTHYVLSLSHVAKKQSVTFLHFCRLD